MSSLWQAACAVGIFSGCQCEKGERSVSCGPQYPQIYSSFLKNPFLIQRGKVPPVLEKGENRSRID